MDSVNLYYYNWFMDIAATPAVVQDLSDNLISGKNFVLLTCDGALEGCWKNLLGDRRICSRCRFWQVAALRRWRPSIEIVTVDSILEQKRNEIEKLCAEISYQTLDDIKSLNYQGAWIGWAAFSTYVSIATRSAPAIDKYFRKVFDPLLNHSLRLAVAINSFFDSNNVHSVTIFNGRTSDTRPVFDLARKRCIEVRSLELVRCGDGEFRSEVRINALPQDVDATSREIDSLWVTSKTPIEERYAVAQKFFEGRRSGAGTRDVRSWVAHQLPGLLPEHWSNDRFNIVFYTSSEFEIAGVRELQLNASFGSQVEGIEEIARSIQNKPKAYLIVKVHPNSKNGKDPIEDWLFGIANKYGRVKIERAESEVSTYSLMQAADLVVTANSTMGIEAAYWGKPVVLTGAAGYERLGATYKVVKAEEVTRLIAGRLKPRPSIGAVKYAFWLMAVEERTSALRYKTHYLQILSRKIAIGHDIFQVLGSSVLFVLLDTLLFRRRWSLTRRAVQLDFDKCRGGQREEVGG